METRACRGYRSPRGKGRASGSNWRQRGMTCSSRVRRGSTVLAAGRACTAAGEQSGWQQATASLWSQIDLRARQASSGGYKPSTIPTYYGGTERRAVGIASTARQSQPRRTASLLAKPCRKREATDPLPKLALAPPSGGSARWESSKQRVLGRIRQGT